MTTPLHIVCTFIGYIVKLMLCWTFLIYWNIKLLFNTFMWICLGRSFLPFFSPISMNFSRFNLEILFVRNSFEFCSKLMSVPNVWIWRKVFLLTGPAKKKIYSKGLSSSSNIFTFCSTFQMHLHFHCRYNVYTLFDGAIVIDMWLLHRSELSSLKLLYWMKRERKKRIEWKMKWML